jgi:type II secretory pathway component PulF
MSDSSPEGTDPRKKASSVPLNDTQAAELGRLVAQAVESELPLGTGLLALADAVDSAKLAKTLRQIADLIDKGASLPDAMSACGLPAPLRGIIETGLQTGRAAEVIRVFTDMEIDSTRLRRRIRAALIYPLLVGVILFMLLMVLAFYVVPSMQAIYEDFGTELPGLTLFGLWLAGLFRHPVVLGLIAIVVFVALIPPLRRVLQLVRFTPIIGDIVWSDELRCVSRRLALLLELGMPLPEALRRTATSLPRGAWSRKSLNEVASRVEGGMNPSEAFAVRCKLSLGVRSFLMWEGAENALPDAFHTAADIQQSKALSGATLWEMVAPIVMYVGVAMVCGLTVIALFLPMIKLITELSG